MTGKTHEKFDPWLWRFQSVGIEVKTVCPKVPGAGEYRPISLLNDSILFEYTHATKPSYRQQQLVKYLAHPECPWDHYVLAAGGPDSTVPAWFRGGGDRVWVSMTAFPHWVVNGQLVERALRDGSPWAVKKI